VEEQNRALIRTLYDSLDRHDGEGMAACYAPTAQFRDPAFGELSGAEAGDMWRMLTGRAEDLSVELADHDANDETGTAHWIAHYTFTDTGRPVVNDVRARFRFADGLIVEHVDEFSFFGWSRQALGPLGLALGWTPLLPILVRRRTRGRLDAFRAERARGR
jgi:ketosteroid isomerase-like protein